MPKHNMERPEVWIVCTDEAGHIVIMRKTDNPEMVKEIYNRIPPGRSWNDDTTTMRTVLVPDEEN